MAARRVLVTDSDERSGLAACRGLAAASFDVTAGVSMRPAPGPGGVPFSVGCAPPSLASTRPPSRARSRAPFGSGRTTSCSARPRPPRSRSRPTATSSTACIGTAFPRTTSSSAASTKASCWRSRPRPGWMPRPAACARTPTRPRGGRALRIPRNGQAAPEPDGVRGEARARQQRSRRVAGRARGRGGALRAAAHRAAARGRSDDLFRRRRLRRRQAARVRGVTLCADVAAWAGSASFSETVEVPASLLMRIGRLLSLLGYEGLFEVELILVDSDFATIDFNPRIYGSMALAEAAGANLAAVWCDPVLQGGGAAPTAARVGVRYRFDDAEVRNALFALRRGRLGEFLGICRPRARVTRAYLRWSDPGPFAGRVAQLCWNGLRRTRPRTFAPGDAPGLRLRAQTLAAGAFHWLLAYAVGVPLVLLARLARLARL